ncbi:DUF547 domain-containing protein [Nonlabens sp. Asnod3-A02]|uniref:DUF547 domain-containing protein n=1 Tax=Nonlabens sp. Asnod3-A02 TaxID=3160579 RepID=UPI0038705201
MRNLLALLTVVLFITSCNSQKKIAEEHPKSKEVSVPMSNEVAVSQPALMEAVKKTPSINLEVPKITENSLQEPKEEKSMEETVIQAPVPAIETSTTIDHSSFDQLLKKYVTDDGHVDYAGLKKERKKLSSYIVLIKNNAPEDSWTKNDLLAYYMNAYNAMTIDLILRNYPTESIKDIKNPWEQRFWQIGDKWINLEEIEHQILRKMDDPRIHFGINCASFSCPPLMNEAFVADKVDSQLHQLAVQFVNDSKRNSITADRVEISNIFKWFKKDFTQEGDIVDFLNKYSKVKINADARVRYMDYNWNLNK